MPGVCRPQGNPWAAVALVMLFLLAAFQPPLVEAARVSSGGDLPFVRVGGAAVWTGDAAYVFGGRAENWSFHASILKYDPATDLVTTQGELMEPGRHAPAAVWTGQYAYVFGGAVVTQGTHPDTGESITYWSATDDIVRFDPATGDVQTLIETSLPDGGAWGMSAVWDAGEGVAYLFGGFSFSLASTAVAERRDWILKFDPDAPIGERIRDLNSGTSPQQLPYPVQDAAAAVTGTKAYLFGGAKEVRNSEGDVELRKSADILVFDMVGERISTHPRTLPYAVQFARAANLKGDIYVFGGQLGDNSATAEIQRFRLTDGGLIDTHPIQLPSILYAPAVAADGETAYLFGGTDASGQSGTNAITKFYAGVTPPAAPQDLKVTSDTTGVSLTWEAPFYDGGAEVSAYRVYRVSPDDTITPLGETTTLSYHDATAEPGVAYRYRVTAVNAAGESGTAAQAAVTAALRPPSAPRGLEAYPGDNVTYLRWQPPEDLGGHEGVTYRLYRNTSTGREPIATGLTGTTYVDNDVVNHVQYRYTVDAKGNPGVQYGPAAPEVTATPSDDLPSPPTGLGVTPLGDVTCDGLRLQWDPVEDADGYLVRYGTDPTDLALNRSVTSTGGLQSTDLTELDQGVRYWFDVRAVVDQYRGPPSSLQSGACLAAPGAPLNVTTAVGEGFILVRWKAPEDLGGAAEVLYSIERDPANGGESRVLQHAEGWTGTHWRDNNVTAGATYNYTVHAYVFDRGNVLEGPGNWSGPVEALVAKNEVPVPQLTANRINPSPMQTVTFDASNSIDPDNGNCHGCWYYFDFGDGTSSGWVSSPTIHWIYSDNGTYTATVKVRDSRGLESAGVASVQLVVGPVSTGDDNGTNPVDDDPPANDPDGPSGATRTGFLGLPGPGALLVAAAAVAVALLARRRSH